jgi:hypothetical protein
VKGFGALAGDFAAETQRLFFICALAVYVLEQTGSRCIVPEIKAMGYIQALTVDVGGQSAEPSGVHADVVPLSSLHRRNGKSTLVITVRSVRISDSEAFVTRYQAKRVLSAVPQGTRHVCFDFAGVGSIGPAFADEIFFIYARQNPGVEIVWKRAAAFVKNPILWAMARSKKYGVS